MLDEVLYMQIRLFRMFRERAGLSARVADPFLLNADIIAGKIANDQTNRVITTYLNGLYGEVGSRSAAEIAIGLLLPDRLKDQICFRTQDAVNRLTLVEVSRYDV